MYKESEAYSSKSTAALLLGRIGRPVSEHPVAFDLLLDALKRGEAESAAVEALGLVGDKRAIEPLSAMLATSDEDVRKKIIVALGQLGDSRAIESLSEGNES
jgi:HEAT repeat protein